MAPSLDDDESARLSEVLVPLALMLLDSASMGECLSVAGGSAIIGSLDESEVIALREFQHSSQQCLAALTGETIRHLQKLSLGERAMRKARASLAVSGRASSTRSLDTLSEEQQCVFELFNKYDASQTGVLSSEEFRNAFMELAGEDCDRECVDTIMKRVDTNEDGEVDLQEFIAWLWGRTNSEKASSEAGSSKERLARAEAELTVKRRAMQDMEDQHEEEMAATHDFWKEVAKHAVMTIDQKVDLENAEWLGNGKYGFVLKARRLKDNKDLVVKMMGIRWSHLAVKEYKAGTSAGKHPNIVEYEDVMLHADDDKSLAKLLQQGYDAGKLKSRTKRTKFPDRYICLTQELMNRGTVQDWLDDCLLTAGGMFNVIQQTATALAFMHKAGSTHNDIKPENIMLHQEGDDDKKVTVKLGDLGLARKSDEVTADYSQFGMTMFCLITGVRFGERKYRADHIEDIVTDCATAIEQAGVEGKLAEALKELPPLLRRILKMEATMAEVSSLPCLRGWDFLSDDSPEDEAQPEVGKTLSFTSARSAKSPQARESFERKTRRKATQRMGE